jgi:hypothetical protein
MEQRKLPEAFKRKIIRTSAGGVSWPAIIDSARLSAEPVDESRYGWDWRGTARSGVGIASGTVDSAVDGKAAGPGAVVDRERHRKPVRGQSLS